MITSKVYDQKVAKERKYVVQAVKGEREHRQCYVLVRQVPGWDWGLGVIQNVEAQKWDKGIGDVQ
jgi:hypothetical protein